MFRSLTSRLIAWILVVAGSVYMVTIGWSNFVGRQSAIAAAEREAANATEAAERRLIVPIRALVEWTECPLSVAPRRHPAPPLPFTQLSIAVPARWTSVVRGTMKPSYTITAPVPPGSSASATFTITSGPAAWNGDLAASARWTDLPADASAGAGAKAEASAKAGERHLETAAEKARNVSPIKINEFQIAAGAPANPTNSFIELHNAGTAAVDISNWTLTEHATQQAISSAVKIPAGTKLAAGGFYLLGLSNSGLAAAARKGETTIHVRSTTGMTVGDPIVIGTGSSTETRTIASIGTPAANGTTLGQPLPDGPVITIPAGSTNVPVTNVAGFVVGEKIALGYGASYPVVARTMEKHEVAMVTAVGKPGTQGRLAAAAPARSSILKVSAVDNISAGDKIRLDIASVGHGIESVTVVAVGTAGANGTGLTIAEKLKFDHASNMPFSDRGTRISVSPAMAFAHASNEPVQALGSGITLDRPLTNDHAIDAVVRDARVTTAGYQGAAASASAEAAAGPTPNQWFGGPAFSTNAGSIVLRDAAGFVADSLNYGGLVDPWAAEGYQATSGAGQGGCRAPVPGVGGRGGGPGGGGVNRSAGRFPDGADADSNCTDSLTQVATVMLAASAAGAANIKVASVADFAAGQSIIVDTGADAETAVIAAVGTPGATTVSADAAAGATVVTVASAAGFSAGQTITIGSGASAETAVVVSSASGRGGGGGAAGAAGAAGGRGGAPIPATITVASPLALAHAAGAQVSGTGITLTAALSRAHASGATVATSAPTPGAPNKYYRVNGGR